MILKEIDDFIQQGALNQVDPELYHQITHIIRMKHQLLIKPMNPPRPLITCLDFLHELMTFSNDLQFTYHSNQFTNTIHVSLDLLENSTEYVVDYVPVMNATGLVYKISIDEHVCDGYEDFLQYFVDTYLTKIGYW